MLLPGRCPCCRPRDKMGGTVIRPLCIPGVPPADAVSVPLAKAIRRDPDEGIPVVRSCERTRRPQWHANSSDQAEDVNVMRVDLLTIDLGGHLRTRRRDDAAVGLLRSGRKATYPRRSGQNVKAARVVTKAAAMCGRRGVFASFSSVVNTPTAAEVVWTRCCANFACAMWMSADAVQNLVTIWRSAILR